MSTFKIALKYNIQRCNFVTTFFKHQIKCVQSAYVGATTAHCVFLPKSDDAFKNMSILLRKNP